MRDSSTTLIDRLITASDAERLLSGLPPRSATRRRQLEINIKQLVAWYVTSQKD